MNAAPINVEVVCAWPHRVWSVRLALPLGSTLGDALDAARCREEIPGLGEPVKAGIHGRVVPATHELVDGDRVELYRPLLADPKDARRRRAAGQG